VPDRIARYLAEVRNLHTAQVRTYGPSEEPPTPAEARALRAGAARLVAEDVPRLLAAVEAALAVADEGEHGALRWENPLPVPEYVGLIRERIGAALTAAEVRPASLAEGMDAIRRMVADELAGDVTSKQAAEATQDRHMRDEGAARDA
jgi:hypothetical protein